MPPKKKVTGDNAGFLSGVTSGWKMVLVVHFNIFIYAMTFWMVKPVMPFLSRELGADAELFGWLESAFSVAQILGGMVVGYLTDLLPLYTALNLCMAGVVAHYALLG